MDFVNKIKFVEINDKSEGMVRHCLVRSGRQFFGVVYLDDIILRVLLGKTVGQIKQQIKDEFTGSKKSDGAPGEVDRQIFNYLGGQPLAFECKVGLRMDGFMADVIRECSKIPYGAVLTYGQLATKAGNAKAARAAGTAMSNNPTPLVVPCHRIVRSDGKVGKYSAGNGTETKIALLNMEEGSLEYC